MERLTNKNNNDYTLKVKGDCVQAIHESHQEQEELAINKLGQLEDIEEELGFDLIKLFKALYNGVYYIKDDQIVYGKPIGLYNEMINIAARPKFTGLYIINKCVLFSQYGKSWALTAEELEEDKE